MATERRYGEDEVREIFELAARRGAGDLAPVSGADGLTLANLQAIGLEAGLEPSAVAQAAAAIEARATTPRPRTLLGLPVAVGRTVPLPRALTDLEWERLVAELRTTFGARGRVSSQGGLREWVNGNLHAYIEPSASGYHLRLGTVKGDAGAMNAIGAVGIGTGVFVFGALGLAGGLPEAGFIPWLIGATGAAALLTNVIRLPRWARERDQQMASIAARIGAIMDTEPTPGGS